METSRTSIKKLEAKPGARDMELDEARRRVVDPQVSWISFRSHSKRLQEGQKTARKKKNKKNKKRLRCPKGPVGPTGPRGPPGLPGAVISQEVMIREFNALVKEAAEKQTEELALNLCSHCFELLNSSSSIRPPSEEVAYVPRIAVGFHMRLRRHMVISGETFIELKTFHQPFAGGAFQRGDTFNIRNGRFGAPQDGIYQFSLNLHIKVKRKWKHFRKKDTLKIQICIDSQCQQYASLTHYSGLESNSRVFTISFMGFLEMKTGQYSSVYVDNASGVNVVVQHGSDFTGLLVGL